MSATLNLSAATVAANGKTVTATISGGTGTGYAIADKSGLIVRWQDGPTFSFPITSASVAGTTLTITLAQPVGTGETIRLNITTTATLTDSGGNTPAGQSVLGVTNNSTVAVSFISCDSGLLELGYFGTPTADTGYHQLPLNRLALDTSCDYPVEFVANGTDIAVVAYGGGGPTGLARVNGGAEASLVNDPDGWWNIKSVASGLAAGNHLVTVHPGDYFWGVRIAGGSHSIVSVPTTKRTLLPNTGTYAGIPQATEVTIANAYQALGDGSVSTGNYVGMELDLQIDGTGLEILSVAHQNSQWACEVDGGNGGSPIKAGDAIVNNANAWVTLKHGLAPGTHTLHNTFIQQGAGTSHKVVRVLRNAVTTSAAAQNATSLVVNSVTYINVGDWVRIDSYSKREWRKVAAVAGTGPYTLTVAALSQAHDVGAQVTSYSASAATVTTWKKIDRTALRWVAIGDSNTQGANYNGFHETPESDGTVFTWYDPRTTGLFQLSNTMNAELVNLATQGWGSETMAATASLYDSPADMTHGLVDAAFVWPGVNDINGTTNSPAIYKANVETIVTALQNILQPAAKIFLLPPLAPDTTNSQGLNKATALTALQQIAATNPSQITCVSNLGDNITPEDRDGLHFMPSGQAKVAATLAPLVGVPVLPPAGIYLGGIKLA